MNKCIKDNTHFYILSLNPECKKRDKGQKLYFNKFITKEVKIHRTTKYFNTTASLGL